MLGDECVLGLDCVAGVFLGCVVVVVLAVVGTFIFGRWEGHVIVQLSLYSPVRVVVHFLCTQWLEIGLWHRNEYWLMICLLHMEQMDVGVFVDDLLVVFCLLEVRDSVRRLRKREASLPSTVETPTFGRPEV